MKQKALYFECAYGISGDMTAAALLDLGADKEHLIRTLKSLPVKGWDVTISRVKKNGIACCDFAVLLDEDNHDADMDYLYGHRELPHSHEQHHDHPHAGHDHCRAEHHEHRTLGDINEILKSADLTPEAYDLALEIFTILAEAEASAHGQTPDTVHFHEVGAIDSIIDIVSCAVLFTDLGIHRVIIPSIAEGSGLIRCAHGLLPVPVPAVSRIMEACGLTVSFTGREAELITPTGAAVAAALKTENVLPENCRILKIGCGAGKRAYEIPSILRVFLLEVGEESQKIDISEPDRGLPDENVIIKLETNIDDCSSELLGYVMERLFEAGARDVYFTPVFMKKNRPAYLLSVLCMPDDADTMEEIIFAETTTIGIRRVLMERTIAGRSVSYVQTSLGRVAVKECTCNDTTRCYPEYESVKALAKAYKLSYQDTLRIIMNDLEI